MSAGGRSAEELRRAALEALGTHADERAIDALRHSAIAIAPAAARWDISAGPVEAHIVTLTLDAKQLGRLRAAPAIVDALCASLAAAIAIQPGETLLELALRWGQRAGAEPEGYRDAPGPPVSLRDALVEYLDAAGEPSVATAVASATLSSTRPTLDQAPVVHVDAGSWEVLRTRTRALAALTRAVRDLLGDPNARVTAHSAR